MRQGEKRGPGRPRVYGDPPPHGPLCRVERSGGRWRLLLTDRGRKYLEAYLARYPEAGALIRRTMGTLWSRAIGGGLTREEIEAAAAYGLVRAATLYDPARGVRFGTYASYHVRNQVQRLLAESEGWDLIDPETISTFFGSEPDRPDLERADDVRALYEAVRGLPARSQRVLRLRFGLEGERPQTLSEASKVLGLSRERVRQIEAQAIASLRHAFPSEVP